MSERLAALERELEDAIETRDMSRVARLRERIADLRCGCRRMRELAA